MPVDHFCLRVAKSQLEPIVEFITKSLEPLGIKEVMRPVPTAVGLGDSAAWLWFTGAEGDEEAFKTVLKGTHVAFTAESMSTLYEFHGCKCEMLTNEMRRWRASASISRRSFESGRNL